MIATVLASDVDRRWRLTATNYGRRHGDAGLRSRSDGQTPKARLRQFDSGNLLITKERQQTHVQCLGSPSHSPRFGRQSAEAPPGGHAQPIGSIFTNMLDFMPCDHPSVARRAIGRDAGAIDGTLAFAGAAAAFLNGSCYCWLWLDKDRGPWGELGCLRGGGVAAFTGPGLPTRKGPHVIASEGCGRGLAHADGHVGHFTSGLPSQEPARACSPAAGHARPLRQGFRAEMG